ncbi:DUF6048 family protein [Patiriisocius sp. Uisw_017]|jgi:hypothetical protein|uniref:DUF6048 family protein n=1 Tax=Patiriisocius sp. Uisw_017 TaxID=3230968 RepID=UPI0039EC5379
MKTLHILLFFISSCFISQLSYSQDESPQDTIVVKNQYGLRAGLDLAKPLRSLLEDGYTGFEIVADFRLTKKLYIAGEIGNEEKDYLEANLNARTKGSYLKIGGDVNVYKNWLGVNNAVIIGLRYGVASFSQELLAYNIYNTNQTFPPSFVVDPQEFNGLTAHWAEVMVGIKAELFNNLYLSLNLQLKHLVAEDRPENFDNLFIPGFNTTNDFSEFGVGYGYSISYLIPLFSK